MPRAARLSLVALAVSVAPLAAGCTEASSPPCPVGTVDSGGLCRRGCTRDDECLVTERCDTAAGRCAPRSPPAVHPTVRRFAATPATISRAGEAVTFEYEVTGADTVEITPGVLAATSALASSVAAPVAATTTFTLSATRGTETATATATVVLAPRGPVSITAFTVTPDRAAPGDSVTLTWQVANAAPGRVKVGDPARRRWVTESSSASASLADVPRALPTEYWLEAEGDDGTVVRAAAVVYARAGAVAIDALAVSPALIDPGDTALVSWQTRGGTSLTLHADTGGADYTSSSELEAASGFVLVGPDRTTRYRLSVHGAGDSSADTRLDVAAPSTPTLPSFTELTIEPVRRSQSGGTPPITVRWRAVNAERVTILADGQSLGDFAAEGHTTLPSSPQANVHLVLRAANQGAVAERHATAWYLVPEEEPNNDVRHADDLTTVGRTAFAIFQPLDEDFYQLDVPEGGGVEARLAARDGGGCGDVQSRLALELLTPDGATQLEAAVNDPATHCPTLEHHHLHAGRYVLHVAVTQLGQGTDYAVLASAWGPTCGDGVAEGGEACDDGNRLPGDGCDGLCAVEPAPDYEVKSQGPISLVSTIAPPEPVVFHAGAGADGVAVLPLAFPFVFYGHRYQGIVVHSSGYLTFRPEPDAAGPPASIPSEAAPNAVIAPLFGDLVLADFPGARGEVLWWSRVGGSGAATHDRAELWFRKLTKRGSTASDHVLVEAVVRLEADTNVVQIHYGRPTVVGQAAPIQFYAGIEDATGRHGQGVPGCASGCDSRGDPAAKLVTFTPR